MLERLKEQVFQANIDLWKHGLVIFTWGNVSGIDRETGMIVIKPSGVPYEKMRVGDMIVLDLYGKIIEGSLNPSSDTPTHLVLYRQFKNIGGIVHTHSEWATSWAQAGLSIPPLGTTHADYFYGEIPCTRKMTSTEISGNYEIETGKIIVESFRKRNPDLVPGVLVNNHGPFAWGNDPDNAVFNARVLEEVAKMAYHTLILNHRATMSPALLEKHFMRKHGKDSYYGQK